MINIWLSKELSDDFKVHFDTAMKYAQISEEKLAKINRSSATALWNNVLCPTRKKLLKSKLIKWTKVLKIAIYDSIDNGLPYYNALHSVYHFNRCIELIDEDEEDKIIPYFCQAGS